MQKRSGSRPHLTVIAILGLMLVAVACGRTEELDSNAGGSTTQSAEATPTYDPNELYATPVYRPEEDPSKGLPPGATEVIETPDPNAPIQSELFVELPPPPSPDRLVSKSAMIIIGRVVEILPAGWTTADGLRPAEGQMIPEDATIITPLVIELEELPIFSRLPVDARVNANRIIVAVMGGQVGADYVEVHPSPEFKVGGRVLMALSEKSPKAGGDWSKPLPSSAQGLSVLSPRLTYLLRDDGMAVSYAGEQPANELIASIRNAAAAFGIATPETAP